MVVPLGFSRTKWVGVEHLSGGVYAAHGVLEDDIYGMELDIMLEVPGFVIKSVEGKMRRITTGECPKALAVIKEAVGLAAIGPDFTATVNRRFGRGGCTHLATLLLECCDTIMRCATYEDWPVEADPKVFLSERKKSLLGTAGECFVTRRGQAENDH